MNGYPTLKALRKGKTVEVDGILLVMEDGEINNGDFYITEKDSNPLLLIYEDRLPYNQTECVKVKEKEPNKWEYPTDIVSPLFVSDTISITPTVEEIPKEFFLDNNKWAQWQREWFFKGLKNKQIPKQGVILSVALSHLKAIQGSWDLEHNHKSAAVAYLASLWLEKPII